MALALSSAIVVRRYRLGHLTNTALIITALVMFAASALLFYGLITGQSG